MGWIMSRLSRQPIPIPEDASQYQLRLDQDLDIIRVIFSESQEHEAPDTDGERQEAEDCQDGSPVALGTSRNPLISIQETASTGQDLPLPGAGNVFVLALH